MRRILSVLLLMSLTILSVQAQEAVLSADAGDLYNEAIVLMGAGNTAEAVLLLERAALAAPRDAQIQATLAELAPHPVSTGFSLATISDAAAGILTMQEHSALVFLSWNLFFGMVVLSMTRPAWRSTVLPLRLLTLISLLIVGGLWTVRVYTDTQQPIVVVMQSTPARTGPGDDYLALPALPTAQTVRLLERRRQWVRVLLSDQSSVWIASSVIKRVIPADSAG